MERQGLFSSGVRARAAQMVRDHKYGSSKPEKWLPLRSFVIFRSTKPAHVSHSGYRYPSDYERSARNLQYRNLLGGSDPAQTSLLSSAQLGDNGDAKCLREACAINIDSPKLSHVESIFS
jgi:hypothetical protein